MCYKTEQKCPSTKQLRKLLLEACRLHVEPDVYMRLHSEVEEIMAEAVRGDWDAIARRAQEEGHYVN